MAETPNPLKKKRGPPTALTEEVSRKVCDAIRGGNYLETAAAYAGISRTSLHEYLKRGRRKDAEEPFASFVAAVDEAMGEAETSFVVRVASAARDPRHWTAAAWWLERRFPERWGRRDRVEHTGAGGGPIEVSGAAEKVAAKIDELAERRASKSA